MNARLRRWPYFFWSLCAHERRPGVYFLLYHKVSGELPIGIDLPHDVFRRQMAHLRRTGRVVSYDAGIAALASGRAPARDMYVLTFDDGYRDFYTHAFPVLDSLRLPATLFVTTRFVDEGVPCVMSAPTPRPPLPVTWAMLRELHASRLVTVAAHTHSHVELPGQSRERVVEELARPRALLEDRLGIAVRHFAYPRAVWSPSVDAEVRRVYDTAAVAGWGKATVEDFDRYRVRRLPILRRDGSLYFRAKLRGRLPEDVQASRRLGPAR